MLRGRPPPFGERWLREGGGCCEENIHRLANGGYGGSGYGKKEDTGD